MNGHSGAEDPDRVIARVATHTHLVGREKADNGYSAHWRYWIGDHPRRRTCAEMGADPLH